MPSLFELARIDAREHIIEQRIQKPLVGDLPVPIRINVRFKSLGNSFTGFITQSS